MERAIYEARLETRQAGRHARRILGAFPYNSLATRSDRGRTRKERFSPGAFAFSLNDDAADITLLRGHQFDAPIASRNAGTLVFDDTPEELRFEATLPPEDEWPSWIRDTVLAIEAGLMRGLSPGFRVPPTSAVPDAEALIPEPGNPGVLIRDIRSALLFEMSILTRAAYKETAVELRAEGIEQNKRRRAWLLTL